MNPIKIDRDLGRRLRFYGFGLLMGCFLVSVITKGKACRLPGTLKLEELNAQFFKLSGSGKRSMNCRGLNAEGIKEIMKKGKVNYSKSLVHEKPFPIYAVDGLSREGHSIRLLIADIADTSEILTIRDLSDKTDSCNTLTGPEHGYN